jgi:hypothetical protein
MHKLLLYIQTEKGIPMEPLNLQVLAEVFKTLVLRKYPLPWRIVHGKKHSVVAQDGTAIGHFAGQKEADDLLRVAHYIQNRKGSEVVQFVDEAKPDDLTNVVGLFTGKPLR